MLSNQVAQRFRAIPGLEPFTLMQVNGTPVVVNNCRRTKLKFADIQWATASGLAIQPSDLVLWLSGPELNGLTLAQGNILVDGNKNRYTIQNAEYDGFTQWWRTVIRVAGGAC